MVFSVRWEDPLCLHIRQQEDLYLAELPQEVPPLLPP